MRFTLIGAGPNAASPRVPLMLAAAWGPHAPSRGCAALFTFLLLAAAPLAAQRGFVAVEAPVI
ncbi:MAG TPA: hypothetical protein VFP94_06835, partial [Terriglobales bacterium]|nr:hypothetical protein [Terriglobales bacterium]